VKFLIDAQLPPVLQRVMEREGFEAFHAKDLGLAPSEDHEIRDYALANDLVVISKDDDFTAYALEPHNLKVIWVRTGNCKNKLLIEVLLANLPACIELVAAGNSLIEISFEGAV
jgi:predicted nuclease of predicted toxin-antitoxin system